MSTSAPTASRRLRDKLLPVTTSVVDVDRLSERMSVVRLNRPSAMAIASGTHIALWVEPGFGPFGNWRRYTVSRADDSSIELTWFRHGSGPGSRMLELLRAGDTVKLRHSDPPLTPRPFGMTVIITDESGIGTTIALSTTASTDVAVILHAADPGDAAALRRNGIEPEVVVSTADDRTGVMAALERHASSETIIGLGQRDTVRDIRRWARSNAPAAQVLHRTYWAPGRTGLE